MREVARGQQLREKIVEVGIVERGTKTGK